MALLRVDEDDRAGWRSLSALRNAKISLSARMVLTLRAKRLTPGYDWCRMADIEPGK